MKSDIVFRLKQGSIGVLPTDTVYGIVASARIPEAVERVYALRNRDTDKPCIVLLPDAGALEEYGIVPTVYESEFLDKRWPGPVSVLFPCDSECFFFLHRGTKMLAFRVPYHAWLRDVLRETGPLIAPSANPQGEPVARILDEARSYFGSRVDLYADGGKLAGESSTLVQFEGNQMRVLREGKMKL